MTPIVHYSNLVRSSDGTVNLSVLMRIAAGLARQQMADIRRLFPNEKPFRSYRDALAEALKDTWGYAQGAQRNWHRFNHVTIELKQGSIGERHHGNRDKHRISA